MASEMASRDTSPKSLNSPGVIEQESLNMRDEFHLFSILPPELRLMIWDFAMPGPRIARVCFNRMRGQTRYSLRPRTQQSSAPQAGSFDPPCVTNPSLLHVNREARHQALKYYSHLTFTSHCKSRPLNIYADLEVDCIHFTSAAGNYQKHTRQEFRRSVEYDFDLYQWIMDLIMGYPARISMSMETWDQLDLDIVAPYLDGLEKLLIIENEIGHEDYEDLAFVDYVEAYMRIEECDPQDELVTARFKGEKEFLEFEIVQDLSLSAEDICRKGFEAPAIELVWLCARKKSDNEAACTYLELI